MYESFYRLRTIPFSLLPDPEFLFLSPRHKSGLNVLEYGLLNRAAFTVLTGEPGMGKTTLLNKVLEEHRARFLVGVIGTTHPNDTSLLPWVADAFGLDSTARDHVGYFRLITSFLRQAFAGGQQVLLVVDEAQNLSLQMLEDLRLLSNLNDGRRVALQIVLAGQPNLRAMLGRSDMYQFAQRISVDYTLEPLGEGDVQAYIRHRLEVAGGDPTLFTDYACSTVYRISGGIPRLINQLCDLSLVYGFGQGAGRITATIVLQAALDRAQGGILPFATDPRTIQLDQDRTARESQDQPSDAHLSQDTSQASLLPSHASPAREGAGAQPYEEGLALKQAKRYEEASKKFETAAMDQHFRFKAAAQQGLCLQALGRIEEAVASFRQALAADGGETADRLTIRYVLAQTLDSLGKIREAQEQYRMIYHADPLFRDVGDRLAAAGKVPSKVPSRSGGSSVRQGSILQPVAWLKALKARWVSYEDR